VDDGFLSAKCCFDLSIQHDECFFKVMAMRPRAAAGRDMHIDHAEPAFCVVSINGDGVGISDETDVEQFSFMIGFAEVRLRLRSSGGTGGNCVLVSGILLLLEVLSISFCGPKIERANARADCDADKTPSATANSVI